MKSDLALLVKKEDSVSEEAIDFLIQSKYKFEVVFSNSIWLKHYQNPTLFIKGTPYQRLKEIKHAIYYDY